MKNNAFGLVQSLLSLLILMIAISLLINCIYALNKQKEVILDDKIHKEWFYSD